MGAGTPLREGVPSSKAGPSVDRERQAFSTSSPQWTEHPKDVAKKGRGGEKQGPVRPSMHRAVGPKGWLGSFHEEQIN